MSNHAPTPTTTRPPAMGMIGKLELFAAGVGAAELVSVGVGVGLSVGRSMGV